VPGKTISERNKLYAVIFTNKFDLYIGERARRIEEREIAEKEVKRRYWVIKGITANRGHVKGTARIVNTNNDMKKMKKGDIFVSTMTTPRLYSAVAKASAIVTDEGGITCHAAIISRELGIPCIIGTKHATKVLKDGDYVEVDADKGTVRKIR